MGVQLTAIERVADLDIFSVSPEGMTWRWREPANCGDNQATNTVDLVPRLGLVDRLDRWFSEQQQRSTEARLAKAHDVFELERMIRDLDRTKASNLW